jgi:hypothetical protein
MIPLTRTLYEQNIILMIFYTIQQHHRILQSDTLPMPPDIERRRIGCRQASLADIRTRTETASLFFSVIKRLRCSWTGLRGQWRAGVHVNLCHALRCRLPHVIVESKFVWQRLQRIIIASHSVSKMNQNRPNEIFFVLHDFLYTMIFNEHWLLIIKIFQAGFLKYTGQKPLVLE